MMHSHTAVGYIYDAGETTVLMKELGAFVSESLGVRTLTCADAHLPVEMMMAFAESSSQTPREVALN